MTVAHRLLFILPTMSKRTILVVEDDPAALQSYGRLLRRLGHRVLLAGDCDQANRDLQETGDVDLLILDNQMPAVCGLEFLATLRRAWQGGRSPVVLLVSAFLSADLRARARLLGVSEILEKPVDPRRFLDRVRALLAEPDPEPVS